MLLRLIPLTAILLLSLATQLLAQNPRAALASLPEADTLIYVNPQKIFIESGPRVATAAELTEMRTTFAELK